MRRVGTPTYEERTGAYTRIALRNGGEISDEIRRRVERDLDLEESRLLP